MNRPILKRPISIVSLALLGLLPGPGHGLAQEAPAEGAPTPDVQDRGAPLTLAGLLDSLALRNPGLRAKEAVASAAAARVAEASTLPDPMLQLGIMNFGIPDLGTDMPTSMAPSVQLMQVVPFPGKLGLRGQVAEAARGMAEAGAGEAWWDVRQEAAGFFYQLYALDRNLEVMEETLGLLRDFQTVARALYSSGTGRQADVLRADVEVARLDGEIRRTAAARTATAARLNALLDRPAGTHVASPVLQGLPSSAPSQDTLSAWAWESRPVLQRGRLSVEQAARRSELVRRDLWPDLTLGMTYGQRDAGMGTERMGSVSVGFNLPVHAGRRQLAARDAAEAERRVAEAELQEVRSEVDARIAELLADLERSRGLVDLYRDEVLPAARATVESALASYRVGAVDFMTLVEAQRTVSQYEGELYELLAEYGEAVAGLESAVGRPLPRTGGTLAALDVEAR